MSDKDVKVHAPPIRPTMTRMWLAALGVMLRIKNGLGFDDNYTAPLIHHLHQQADSSSMVHRSQKKRRLLARRANRYP